MFVLVADPVIKGEVVLSVPGGQPARVDFFFRYKTPHEFAEWFDYFRPRRGLDRVKFLGIKAGRWITRKGAPTARDVLLKGVTGWEGIQDEAGADLPFSTGALKTLLDAYPKATMEILGGYFKAVLEGHEKN